MLIFKRGENGKMYSKFIKRTLCTTLAFLLIFAMFVVVIDPFFHYHKPLDSLKPVVNNERYQNPGIAKHFEYDSVIVGSSMTQNFRVSEFNETFGCDTVKLTYPAIRTGNYKYMFEAAFDTHEVKNVFMGLDIDPLIDGYGNFYFPLPEYLYDKNPLNDVNYVLNKDVLFGEVYNVLESNYKDTVPEIDEAYTWTGVFSKEAAVNSMFWDYKDVKEPYEIPLYLENAKLNLENNILPYIEENPDTTFYIFYPPYSLLWWNLHLCKGDLNDIFAVLSYATEQLLQYENVKLFFLHDVEEVITDFELYKDYNHYNEEINSEIIQWFKEDKYRIYPETYEKRISTFKTYVENFDYVEWIEND